MRCKNESSSEFFVLGGDKEKLYHVKKFSPYARESIRIVKNNGLIFFHFFLKFAFASIKENSA